MTNLQKIAMRAGAIATTVVGSLVFPLGMVLVWFGEIGYGLIGMVLGAMLILVGLMGDGYLKKKE